MAKDLTSDFFHKLAKFSVCIPPKYQQILVEFHRCYLEALVEAGQPRELALSNLRLFLELLEEGFRCPYTFPLYHQKVLHPINYYQFGLDFIRPLIDLQHSKLLGESHLDEIALALQRKENVILLANHQTEPDPQAIAIMLEKKYPEIAKKIIYVAGERVITDPLAIPFSMGCDLLCIYSKRYIDNPPELKRQKQLHNKQTMQLMSNLLKEGGKIIYVAPSGGRDRRNGEGIIEIAPFDPQSVEMIYLMASKAAVPTHFYPLSLATYDIFPPPDSVQQELGEMRRAKRCPIYVTFSSEFNMEDFPGSKEEDKIAKRKNRSNAIWNIVQQNYLKALQ